MALNAPKRITNTTLPDNKFSDGDVLYGADLNKPIDVLKAGINANYEDLKSVVTGGSLSPVVISPNLDMQYIRLNADKAIEVSNNGEDWAATASSGHLILNQYGDVLPQRARLKFLNTIITDDGVNTIISGLKGDQGEQGKQGIQGPVGETGSPGLTGPGGPTGIQGVRGEKGETGTPGADGKTFVIRGRFNNYAELTTVYPVGQEGWAYAVGSTSDNVVYIWDLEVSAWKSLGKLQGPAGPQGPQGEMGVQGATGETGATGVQGIQGPQGPIGLTGPQGEPGPTGQGVPAGGSTEQFLYKTSNNSYATGWQSLYTISQLDAKFNTLLSQEISVTLPVGSWANNVQTVSVAGVTATSNQEITLPKLSVPPTSAELANQRNVINAGLKDAGQASGSITLYADVVPTTDITIRIIKRGTK